MAETESRAVVLVVDDSFTNRALLSKILSTDFQVEQAENGVIALEKLRKKPWIAAVILDIEMPELDGFGVLAAMRENPALREIPVVVDTVVDDEESQIKALDGGAADFLIKPFNPRLALHRVRNLIARQEAAREAARAHGLEEMLRQSEIDEKTGVYTRQAFCRKASEMMQANPDTEYVILRWDIDHFKVFNDMYGVKVGDELLALIGKTMRSCMDGTMLYGHWNADHFVMCIPQKRFIDDDIARHIASHRPAIPQEFELFIRIGVYSVHDRSIAVELMCDRALLALQSIKGDFTKRCAYYDDSMRAVMLEEQEIIGEMDRALSQGQFVVYLQPQVNFATNTLHGAEALVRWKHPRKGIIPPGQFIPIFERSGFISRMDEYVWEEACRLQRGWLDEGLSVVPVSVNISRRDIYNPRLCEHITSLVSKYRLSPEMLHLEITESAYMDNAGQLIKTVEALRASGFVVEMDDFGSGYSSLNTLKDVPVDLLKLDMKFLRDSDGNTKGGNILTSVIRMAQWIRLPVIAEGVETREQAEYLKSVGLPVHAGLLLRAAHARRGL